eukprot:90039_1
MKDPQKRNNIKQPTVNMLTKHFCPFSKIMSLQNVPHFSLCIIGDSKTGKSSFCRRFFDDRFDPYYRGRGARTATTFIIKKFIISVNLYESNYDANKPNVDGIILIFDITNKQSFQNIKNIWIKQIDTLNITRANYGIYNDVSVILVGTKSDLNCMRQVEYKNVFQFANKHNMEYFEISSMKNWNIHKAINILTHNVVVNKIQQDKYLKYIIDGYFRRNAETINIHIPDDVMKMCHIWLHGVGKYEFKYLSNYIKETNHTKNTTCPWPINKLYYLAMMVIGILTSAIFYKVH